MIWWGVCFLPFFITFLWLFKGTSSLNCLIFFLLILENLSPPKNFFFWNLISCYWGDTCLDIRTYILILILTFLLPILFFSFSLLLPGSFPKLLSEALLLPSTESLLFIQTIIFFTSYFYSLIFLLYSSILVSHY